MGALSWPQMPLPVVRGTIRVVSPKLSAYVEWLLEGTTSMLLPEHALNLHMVVVEVTPTVSLPKKSARNDVKIPIPITKMKIETSKFRFETRSESENRLTRNGTKEIGVRHTCYDLISLIDCLVLISL